MNGGTAVRNAPCKVNLTLDVLGRRADGYHDLCSVMQTVSLCDRVTLSEGENGFDLRAEGMELPEGKKTLEQRAAECFFAALRQPMPPLTVTLEKQVPAYAGLGGGSADVAALLWLLRSRYAPNLPPAELERIGALVGSDMPFCIRGGTALAEGRGERLTDLPPLPSCCFVLCKPAFDLPTPALFERIDCAGPFSHPDTQGLQRALAAGDLLGAASCLGNVFEEVLAAEERAAVFALKDSLLSRGALGAAMSGSGPAVFGIFEREEPALAACAELRDRGEHTWLARPVQKFT